MIKNKNKNKGFSLVELLVGIVITISAATLVLSIIISSFRISTKTNTNAILRENGNYALSQISKTIQFSDSFTNVKQGNTEINCLNTSVSNLSEVNVVYNDVNTSIKCSGDRILINNQSSIDSSNVKVVSGSCSFTCKQSGNEGPEIGIDFSLTTGPGAAESTSRLNFSTSVKMRNL